MPSHPEVKVALAQINVTVGDLDGNVAKIIEFSRRAHAQGAQLVLTPELSLCGYPPEDLLLRPAFVHACERSLVECAAGLADLPGLHVVVGHPYSWGEVADVRSKSRAVPRLFNSVSVLAGGKVVATYAKRELPNYQVFDERRYFASGRDAGLGPVVFEAGGLRFGLLICEDAWFDEPAQAAQAAGAQVLCVLNASPFHLDKVGEREERMALRARTVSMPLLYAHLTGGQDEIVFDGASFALNSDGRLAARAPFFKESLDVLSVTASGVAGSVVPMPSTEAQAWAALVTGVRDYLGKNRFPGALIGLSGGIDSALVLAIAVDALGADKVHAVMMPSRYTADISLTDARQMAQRLGVRYDEISIEPMFEVFKASLAPQFAGRAEDTTEENIQARIRGTLLMALSNKFGAIVLTTGNKSEMATGYCTLYGDMAGGFAVIKDVAKTLVYRLANWRNLQPVNAVRHDAIVHAHTAMRSSADALPGAEAQDIIPRRIIDRPPSAELRADQTDQDSLPPYDVLDAILQRYMEEDKSIAELIAEGFRAEDVERVTHLIKVNEYKRRQAPIGIRITLRAFGRDWRYPITSKFRA